MKISTLGEFVEAVSKIKRNSVTGGSTKPIWFRGHSDIGWELKPSLYRGSHDPEYEREMIRDFKLNLHNFGSSQNLMSSEQNGYGWCNLSKNAKP